MSVAHWGETGIGEWKVEVFVDDSKGDQVEINFKDWQFRIFGESIDGDKAEVYDITKDYAAIRRIIRKENKIVNQPLQPAVLLLLLPQVAEKVIKNYYTGRK